MNITNHNVQHNVVAIEGIKPKVEVVQSTYNRENISLSRFIETLCTEEIIHLALDSKGNERARDRFIEIVSHEIKTIENIELESCVDRTMIMEQINKMVGLVPLDKYDRTNFIGLVEDIVFNRNVYNDCKELLDIYFPKEEQEENGKEEQEIENGKEEQEEEKQSRKSSKVCILLKSKKVNKEKQEIRDNVSVDPSEEGDEDIEDNEDLRMEKERRIRAIVPTVPIVPIVPIAPIAPSSPIVPRSEVREEDRFLNTVSRLGADITERIINPNWKRKAWEENYTIEDFRNDIRKYHPTDMEQAYDILSSLLPKCMAKVDLGTNLVVFVKTKIRTKQDEWSVFRRKYTENESGNQFKITFPTGDIEYIWMYSLWYKRPNLIFNELDLPFIKSVIFKRKKLKKDTLILQNTQVDNFLTALKSGEFKLNKDFIISHKKHGFIITKHNLHEEFLTFCKKNKILCKMDKSWFGRNIKGILGECNSNHNTIEYYKLPIELVSHQ